MLKGANLKGGWRPSRHFKCQIYWPAATLNKYKATRLYIKVIYSCFDTICIVKSTIKIIVTWLDYDDKGSWQKNMRF